MKQTVLLRNGLTLEAELIREYSNNVKVFYLQDRILITKDDKESLSIDLLPIIEQTT